jgi:hypothetical protein
MNKADMREMIRRELMARTTKLWTGSKMDVPVLTLSEPLKMALQKARLQGRIRYGLEPILEKLAGEKRGIANVRRQTDAP